MSRLCRECRAVLQENPRTCICGKCAEMNKRSSRNKGARCVPQSELCCPRCGPVEEWIVPVGPGRRALLADQHLGMVGLLGASPGANLGFRKKQEEALETGPRKRARSRIHALGIALVRRVHA